MSAYGHWRIGLVAGTALVTALWSFADTQVNAQTTGGASVEAPDVFDVTDEALWDGRPSLGRVWVAYEGAAPTRVIIRNQANGKVVTGGLFRRERFFPGPPFQLSSDAAAELGILAGQPTTIRVTALVEETPPEPAAPAEEAAAVAAVATAPVPATEGPNAPQPIAVAPASVAPPVVEDAADEAVVADGADDTSADETIVAAAAAIAAAEVATTDVGTAPAETAAPQPAPARRSVAEGPNSPQPVAAAPAASSTLAAEPAIVAAVDTATLDSQPPATGRFVQVAAFSEQANTSSVSDQLGAIGIVPLIEEAEDGLWHVLVGPLADSAETEQMLIKLRGEGFGDAFPVTR